MLFTETFTFSLQVDFDDVAAVNPELLQLLPLHTKDNLPLQENVTVQVAASHLTTASAPEDALGLFGSLLVCFLGLLSTSAQYMGPG